MAFCLCKIVIDDLRRSIKRYLDLPKFTSKKDQDEVLLYAMIEERPWTNGPQPDRIIRERLYKFLPTMNAIFFHGMALMVFTAAWIYRRDPRNS